jgi:hypothetical protein
MYVIILSIPELWMNMLMMLAMMIPPSAMYNKLPNFVKSVFVVYPKMAMIPNAPDAAKKVSAIDPIEYCTKTKDKLNPMSTEYKINRNKIVLIDMRSNPILIANTTTIGENITT